MKISETTIEHLIDFIQTSCWTSEARTEERFETTQDGYDLEINFTIFSELVIFDEPHTELACNNIEHTSFWQPFGVEITSATAWNEDGDEEKITNINDVSSQIENIKFN